ncbi:hypothetical protein K4L44_10130 [Halosquirtibacter laminarini]|uniref:Uncharacterized protein n=1 Tax=Halosquirtibacter laminarini TaxID=3374600 RepID=A0AC61NHY5_9BACT|nr:hypothetical protein K4L44_10130 [Prolixibacteraceae bacterium]
MTKKKCKSPKIMPKESQLKYKCKKCGEKSEEKKQVCKPQKVDPKD